MRNAAGKRLPHGTTLALVMDALWRLHAKGGRIVTVSREELVGALALPETTVDDRLRVLVKQGRALRTGRGKYRPTPLSRWSVPPHPRGTESRTYDDGGNPIRVVWL